jgi:hypothetical protein
MAKRKSTAIKFRETDITAMQHDATRANLDFTKAQVQKILSKNPGGYTKAIWDDFERCGHPSGEYGMDTMVRDLWFSAIAFYYTGRDWPLNMEDDSTSKKFFTKLKTALKKDKVKIIT